MTAMKQNHLARGALLMLSASLLFAVTGALIKQVSVTLPNEMVVFFRNLFGLAVLSPFFLHRGPNYYATKRLGAHLVRALTGLAAMYCYFYAIGHLPLAEAVLLNYTAPLFIPLAAFLWVGETVPRHFVWPITIGFIGIAMILKPGVSLLAPIALIGLAAGMFSALAMAGIRKLTNTEPAMRVVFYFSLASTLVSAVPLAWHWQTPADTQWLPLLLIGILSTAAQIFMTRGYACAPAAQVGPFLYTIVVFAALFGWLFWQEIPDVLSFSGAALVALAGILTIRMGNQTTATPSELPDINARNS
jgi:drug/metabolite transporter (DMT)-like permease